MLRPRPPPRSRPPAPRPPPRPRSGCCRTPTRRRRASPWWPSSGRSCSQQTPARTGPQGARPVWRITLGRQPAPVRPACGPSSRGRPAAPAAPTPAPPR
ncbi:hypothetical protein [Ornithinimicrobium kibberense]|uniref:hypothetical protein n=1 Tax=Ornithinimicrobium kibberense TaxID=282060 RepID=UPI00360D81F3